MAATELGMRLTELNAAAGNPTTREIDRWLVRRGADVAVESIRKAHAGLIDPTKCDAELLAGLASYYKVDAEALGRYAAERMRILSYLMPAPSGPGGGADQRITGTGCIADRPLAPVVPIAA